MNSRTTSHERVPAQRDAEGWLFLTEALRSLRTTGAIAPSSPRLAAALAAPVREQSGLPLNVLEVGAGTGAVTRALVPLLGPAGRLDVVEANPRFAARLHHLLRAAPDAAAAEGRVRVHTAFIEELDTGRRYDAVVSGLPFTNFAPEQVETIMDRYFRLLHPGGTLTYFAYRGTGPARSLLGSRSETARHRAVAQVLARYRQRYATGCQTVWGNLPPARVWRLQAPAATGRPSDTPRPAGSGAPR